MNPDTPLFGRLTLGSNRITLGRAGFTTLFLRAATEIQKLRVNEDVILQLEMSRGKLPDSSSFNSDAIVEQQLAAQIVTDQTVESPFPGISVGRVVEAMSSLEYEIYERFCEPSKRMGLKEVHWIDAVMNYQDKFPDCYPHFPKWID